MGKLSLLVGFLCLFVPIFSMKMGYKVSKKIQLPKEIEVKIQPTQYQLEHLKKWLKEASEYKGIKKQKDVYVDNPKKPFKFKSSHGFLDAYEKLRVRFEKESKKICYKHRHISHEGKTLSCDEFECNVGDQEGLYSVLKLIGFGHIKPSRKFNGQGILDFLKKLGFTEHEIVEKTREKYVYKDFEIVIDNVKKLGLFVEIELKSDEQNVNKGLKKIYKLLNNIGLKQASQFDRSYLHMLWNPKHDFSEIIKPLKIT